jgi:DNA (cytosine-5)-methyltransferase 1
MRERVTLWHTVGMRSGSLFSGYEGLGIAVNAVFGSTTAWVSDVDKGANKVLAYRVPHAPNHGDITKVDWSSVEPVGVVSGGFPCQDLSGAGKRAGMRPGTRSGLWTHMAYAVSQLRPRYVVAENVRGLLSAKAHSDMELCPYCMGGGGYGEPDVRALGAVLGDLAELGYDTQWCGLRASDVGAPHGRFRVFILATDTQGRDGWTGQLGQHQAAERSTRNDEPRGGSYGDASDSCGERHGGGKDSRTLGRMDGGAEGEARQRERARTEFGDRGAEASSDANRRDESRVGDLSGLRGGFDARADVPAVQWGNYEPAIRRWEGTIGRLAPSPVIPAPKGGHQLNPKLNEWMMGLPDGWITDVPTVTRNEALKLAGNGVVPQQAEAALRFMLKQR